MSVVTLQMREASLKRRLRAHFRELGFTKGPDGLLCPPDNSKTSYRSLHQLQRIDKLRKHQHFLDQHGEKLIGFLASGEDVVPAHIQPRLELIDGGTWQSDLFRFASFYWTIPVSQGYGRRLRFLVWDDANGKLLGIIAMGDAVFNLRARDAVVGWDHEQRKERLVNILDAYVLGALPPYSFLLAGKLVACLVKTQEIVQAFQEKYGASQGIISGKKKQPQLVLSTTSSALGRSSVYNRLKLNGEQYFQPIGFTSGWGHFHIPDHLFDDMRSYLAQTGDSYAGNHGFGQGPNWRLRAIRKALTLLGMNDDLIRHGLFREVFLSHVAKNAIPYLMGKENCPDYSALQSVKEVSSLARERWIRPRAERRPEYREWRAEWFPLTFLSQPPSEIIKGNIRDGLRD